MDRTEAKAILDELAETNEDMYQQLSENGRCWLAVARPYNKKVVEALNAYYVEEFMATEIEPDYEHVFYTMDRGGNSYEELLEVAYARAAYRDEGMPC